MTSKKLSAFPSPTDFYGAPAKEYGDRGMTLRDYFAAKAMQGMFAADTADSAIPTDTKARLAYEMADAMLKARSV